MCNWLVASDCSRFNISSSTRGAQVWSMKVIAHSNVFPSIPLSTTFEQGCRVYFITCRQQCAFSIPDAKQMMIRRRGTERLKDGKNVSHFVISPCNNDLVHLQPKRVNSASRSIQSLPRLTFKTILHSCVASNNCCRFPISGSMTKCSLISSRDYQQPLPLDCSEIKTYRYYQSAYSQPLISNSSP